LDAFFNIAITSIYRHGGDVVKFCGDALMCVFLAEQKNLMTSMAASAADCCLDLQKKLRGFKAAEVR
jgi:class 3 adenylate cyclase